MNELLEFTRRALAEQVERDRIAAALEKAGWPEARIRSSLSHYCVVSDFPIPVPVPPPRFSAREAFIYLVMFSAMFLAIWHLVALGFEIVDYLLPDPADPVAGSRYFIGQARWNMSVLIVVYPLFAFIFWATNRRCIDMRMRRLSLARRWLTYMALYSAAVTLIGDIIVVVSNLIAGGLSAPLLAKTALVAFIVGGVFVFYLGLVIHEEIE